MTRANDGSRGLLAKLLFPGLDVDLATGLLVDKAGDAGAIHHSRRGADTDTELL